MQGEGVANGRSLSYDGALSLVGLRRGKDLLNLHLLRPNWIFSPVRVQHVGVQHSTVSPPMR
ncbi:unnamed protein product, partial [Nesidiocoris tenuis]